MQLTAVPRYNKDYPFLSTLLSRRILTQRGGKDVRHLVLRIQGSGFNYEAGDSLGIFPNNHPDDVRRVLAALGRSADEQVAHPKTAVLMSLEEALTKHFSLSHISRNLLALIGSYAEGVAKNRLESLLLPENEEAYKAYCRGRDLIDILEDFSSSRLPIELLLKELRRLLPRLYSISSSPICYPDEIHLTLALTQIEAHGRLRLGVASHYLADRVPLNEAVLPCFLAKSLFRLPRDPNVDIIMVGPGTGVAPFRAFVQERAASKAQGRNWLFFGEQYRNLSFLYQEEWEEALKTGDLHRLDLAFSRDQAEKIYVQDRLWEARQELWAWLQKGAHFYVCGDAKHMAAAVDATLQRVAKEVGGLSEEGAIDYIKALKKERRYQRDVY